MATNFPDFGENFGNEGYSIFNIPENVNLLQKEGAWWRRSLINFIYSGNLLHRKIGSLNGDFHLTAPDPDIPGNDDLANPLVRPETYADGAENMTKIALRALDMSNGDSMAEFGIGTGKVGHRIIENNPNSQYVAFELSKANCDVASEQAQYIDTNCPPIYYNADMAKVADLIADGVIEKKQVDRILALESIVHLKGSLFERTVTQLPHLLKEKGIMFYTDFVLKPGVEGLSGLGKVAIEKAFQTHPRPANYYDKKDEERGIEDGEFARLMKEHLPGFEWEAFRINIEDSMRLTNEATGNSFLDIEESYNDMEYYGVKISRLDGSNADTVANVEVNENDVEPDFEALDMYNLGD